MVSNEQKKEFKKWGITARKFMGDDAFSWAVFVNGRPFVTGLGIRDVDYYKVQALKAVKGGN